MLQVLGNREHTPSERWYQSQVGYGKGWQRFLMHVVSEQNDDHHCKCDEAWLTIDMGVSKLRLIQRYWSFVQKELDSLVCLL